jgi:hypothetical protein
MSPGNASTYLMEVIITDFDEVSSKADAVSLLKEYGSMPRNHT